MTIEILALRFSPAPPASRLQFLGHAVRVRYTALADLAEAADAIRFYDGQVDAIALEGMARQQSMSQRNSSASLPLSRSL